jgi:hypothetical protein
MPVQTLVQLTQLFANLASTHMQEQRFVSAAQMDTIATKKEQLKPSTILKFVLQVTLVESKIPPETTSPLKQLPQLQS